MARSFLQKVFLHDKWNIGIARQSVASIIDGAVLTDADVTWLEEVPGRYFADPFLFVHDGRTWLFFEDYHYKTNTAGLAVVEVFTDGDKITYGVAEPVIAEPFHQSYPYIFVDGRNIYAIPEQSASGRVQLYRAESFPHTWTPAEVLLEGYAGVDATPFTYRGMWWLFVSELGEQENKELDLFFSPTLQGPWQKHPQCPVSTSSRGARMAGNVYVRDDGTLYRMGQDCHATYGGGVVIMEILTLTPEHYREKIVRTLAPFGRYHAGIHTVSHDHDHGELVAIDAKRWADPWEVVVKLIAIARKKFFGA